MRLDRSFLINYVYRTWSLCLFEPVAQLRYVKYVLDKGRDVQAIGD